MKFSRFGICSRSDGTLGLSRVKCTLSNSTYTTCLIFPDGEFNWHCACAEAASPAISSPQLRADPSVRQSILARCISDSSSVGCWAEGDFDHIPDFNDSAANTGLSLRFTSNNAALNADRGCRAKFTNPH